MKNLKAPFLVFALLLLDLAIVSATPAPPRPPRSASISARDAGTTDAGDVVVDDDDDGLGGGRVVPIDQNVIILLIGGLALGATVIYRKQTKKASN